MKHKKNWISLLSAAALAVCAPCTLAFAADISSGADLAGQFVDIFNTYLKAQGKSIFTGVIGPACSMILLGWLVVKLAMSYNAFRKTGEFEWQAIGWLFFGFVFMMVAPNALSSMFGWN